MGGRARGLVRAGLSLGAAWVAAAAAPLPPGDIPFPRPRIFPESITVTRDGTLFVSGADDGTIWRARPGGLGATEWLPPGRSGLVAMFGVLADERHGTLWACGRPRAGDPDEVRARTSALYAFDLASGAPKGRWPMPAGAKDTCNDMAAARDGTVYVAETAGGRVVRLRPGAPALDVWFADPALAGADGIALDRDGTLYVSSVSSSRVFRLPVGRDGAPGRLTELTPSTPLDHPDGMRFMAPGRFLFGENGDNGGISEGRVRGDRLLVRHLPGSRPGTTSAVAWRGLAYGVVAKLRYRAPAMAGQDPGPFAVYAVPLD